MKKLFLAILLLVVFTGCAKDKTSYSSQDSEKIQYILPQRDVEREDRVSSYGVASLFFWPLIIPTSHTS